METLLGQSDGLRSPAAVMARVLGEARRSYSHLADDAFLEACARDAVDELWSDAIKVRSFLPVLAMRRIREVVEATNPTKAHRGEA